MSFNNFQLSSKCPYSCLKCTIGDADSLSAIMNKINSSSQGTLNFFFNLTIDNKELPKIIPEIKKRKQKLGLFYNGLANEEYLKHQPEVILFPFFSTNEEGHDLFIGKKSFYKMISFMNLLPKTIKKPILFFVTKDNLAETTDLAGLLLTFRNKIFMQPLNFYEENDFDKEIMLYLKRIQNQKGISLLPAGNYSAHCLNWSEPNSVINLVLNTIKNINLSPKKKKAKEITYK